MAANPQIRRPVRHFIQFYSQQDEDMGVFSRAVYSWLQVQTESPGLRQGL